MWHYSICKRKNSDGSFRYVIVEDFGNEYGHTVDDISPYGETKEELISTLEIMLEDAKNYPIIEESENA